MKIELIHGSDYYNTQMMYFTSGSFSKDERYLYFLSDMTGCQNAYVKDTQTGEIIALSDNRRAMTYEDNTRQGIPGKGWGRPFYDPERDRLYYYQDSDLLCVDREGNKRVVTKIPADEFCSLPHVSGDGKLICFGSAEFRILDGYGGMDPMDIDRRILDENLCSYINVYEIETGKQIHREKAPRGWVTHIQFSPADSSLILYNHEHTIVDNGIRRVWLWDGKTHRQLRTKGDGRFRDDWVCHEFWSADGKFVYWHGKIHDTYAYIGRIELATGKIHEIMLDHRFSECYGHFSVSREGRLVSDGYWHDKDIPAARPAGAPIYPSEWITVLTPDWEKKSAEVTPVCKHSSSWKTQDDHPHPVFNDSGDMVWFTAGFDGKRKVYRVKWK